MLRHFKYEVKFAIKQLQEIISPKKKKKQLREIIQELSTTSSSEYANTSLSHFLLFM